MFDDRKRKLINTEKVGNNYQLLRSDANSTINNYGAAGSRTVLLPLDAEPGEQYEVIVVPAQTLTIDPGTGTLLQGSTTSTSGQKASSNTQGAKATFLCVDAGPTWLVTGTALTIS